MKKFSSIVLAVISMCLIVQPVLAQSDTGFTISMSRDFGYSSGTGDIQGLFSIHAKGPDNLQRVVFLIDGESIGEDTESPYKLQFSTDSFANGVHTMSAIGYTTDGQELKSNEIRSNFVPAGEGIKAAGAIIGVIFGILIVVFVLAFAITMFSTRRKGALPLGKPRNYGMKGGTVCKRCDRPFAFHIIAMNMLTHRLDFCPHCGKWQMAKPMPLEMLREAEKAELAWDQAAEGEQIQGLSEEEKLRRDLDSSRFE